jgi:hypothetical protein
MESTLIWVIEVVGRDKDIHVNEQDAKSAIGAIGTQPTVEVMGGRSAMDEKPTPVILNTAQISLVRKMRD